MTTATFVYNGESRSYRVGEYCFQPGKPLTVNGEALVTRLSTTPGFTRIVSPKTTAPLAVAGKRLPVLAKPGRIVRPTK